ncbi:MAG: nuclear transport factor 2 family protein [Bdellovibrionaceae bacterium]|nr:nuclear transport factor 2 family protein [Pseudobdellovibrionaceae bacterium]
MTHPNVALLEKLYADYSKGDLTAALTVCANEITFQVAGKSKLAGKFTKETFGSQYVTPMMELTGNSLTLEVHDIMASDRHAVVLASNHLVRNGEKAQLRTVHVWRFENGKPVAWYEYPRDMYAYDTIFS